MRPTDPRVLSHLAVARKPLAFVVAAGVLSSLLVIGQAFALTAVVVAVVRGADVLGPAAVLVAVVVLKALIGVLGDSAAARAAASVGVHLRAQVASAVLAGRTHRMAGGEVASLATRGVTAAEPYLTRYLPALVLAGVLPFLTVVVMATQDVMSALIVLATLPLIPVFGALVGMATRDRAEAQWRAMASLSGHFVDVMKGLPTLVAFRRARAQSGTIRAITHRYRESTLKTLRIAFASSAVLELVATISVALVAVVVGVRLAGGHLDLRTALVVLLLAPEAYWPLRRVGAEFHAAAEGVAAFETVSGLAAETSEPEVTRVPAADRMLIGSQVRFAYPGREAEILAGTDFVVAPRSITAVVGASGSGKSTVLALLAGLLVPTGGSLSVDGVPTGSAGWRSQVSWLPQRPLFLNGTVADNLRLGAPDAGDDRLWDALRRVSLADRIRAMGGLDAQVEEDAGNLSAGERARLALARVVLAGRPWILIDEPTAHLDPTTRRALLEVLVELAKDAAVVVASHDPEVLSIADRVIKLSAPMIDNPMAEPVQDTPAAAVVAAAPEKSSGRPARFVLSTFLGVMASFCGVALTATAGWLIVKASAHPATLTLLVAIVGVRTFGLGRPVFRYAERLRSHDEALRMLAERRVQVYDAVVPLTPGRLGKRRGDVLASMVDDVDAVVDRELRVRLPLRTYAAVVSVVAAVAALFLPAAALIIAATSVTGAVAAYLIARWGALRPESAAVAARAELSTVILDAAQLAPELRMWQAESMVLNAVRTCAERLGRSARAVANLLAVARATVALSSVAGVVGVAWIGRDALASGAISAPGLALLLLVPVALHDVALGVVEAGSLVGRVAAAESRLAAYGAMKPAVTDAVDPAAAPQGHEMRLEEASLGWEGRSVLSGLTLSLREGSKLGVVGPSGSGKSTLASALIRFVDPLEGQVALGGEPLPRLALDDVRERIGYVDDDPHVFATTLVENVRLARPTATDAEVAAALDRACLGPWVRALPNGLQTWLGDGHAEVSGGERARLGLARSLLLDQSVIVLDEPVAHLDASTAQALADDVLQAADGRTVVWITHSRIGLDQMDEVLDLGGCGSAADLSGLVHG